MWSCVEEHTIPTSELRMRTLLAAALAVGLTGLTGADEKRTGTPAEQIKAIEKDFTARFAKANEEIGKADPKDRADLIGKAREDLGKLAKEATALIEANANDAKVVGPGLAFLGGRASIFAGDTKGTYRKVIAGAKDKSAQAIASYMLGAKLLEEGDRGGGKAAAAEGEKLLAKVEKEYADVELNGQKLGPQATDKLYVIRNLAVGKTAPDVEGTDLDGKKVKLSSYRGKVVVLDIWATWCGPCRAMIPHEREMVKKLKDKPFVLLSISADAKKDTLTEFLKKEEMPWSHWWDGQSGPVMKAYRVEFFPNIYVIDSKGVIRHKQIRGEQLEKAVEELVKEAEGSKN
jgi:thiol-disulfide isomerase/thioredoxin